MIGISRLFSGAYTKIDREIHGKVAFLAVSGIPGDQIDALYS